MAGARGVAHSRTAMHASRVAADAMHLDATGIEEWALREFRSTSPWAVARAVSELGRHHSRPWLHRIDVPTAVVVLCKDHVIPPQRQLDLAHSIPGATIHDIDAGHAACVLESEVFVPALVEAASTVNARRRDFSRGTGA
jgi:pimeloyl-ACP methyl ester carboxylesterase